MLLKVVFKIPKKKTKCLERKEAYLEATKTQVRNTLCTLLGVIFRPALVTRSTSTQDINKDEAETVSKRENLLRSKYRKKKQKKNRKFKNTVKCSLTEVLTKAPNCRSRAEGGPPLQIDPE